MKKTGGRKSRDTLPLTLISPAWDCYLIAPACVYFLLHSFVWPSCYTSVSFVLHKMYESERRKKNAESPATLCLIFIYLYWLDPSKNFVSCSLTHYKRLFWKKLRSYYSKNLILGLGKLLHGEKSARDTFFEGLNNNFFTVKTPIFFEKAFHNGLN